MTVKLTVAGGIRAVQFLMVGNSFWQATQASEVEKIGFGGWTGAPGVPEDAGAGVPGAVLGGVAGVEGGVEGGGGGMVIDGWSGEGEGGVGGEEGACSGSSKPGSRSESGSKSSS